MFLDEYPLWQVGGLHHPVILQGMFLQAAYLGQKEAEWMIHQGHQQNLPKLNLDLMDIPAVQLVGYRTFSEEISNLFHEVYLLRRPPGLPPYGPEQMRKVTNDILYSLRSHLEWRKDPIEPEEGQREATSFAPWPSQQTEPYFWAWGGEQPHSKVLLEAKEAHQWALEATHMLEQSIERLSQGDYQPRHQCSHSHSHSWGRIQEWCLPSPSPHRSRRYVTFHEPEEETFANEELQRGALYWQRNGR